MVGEFSQNNQTDTATSFNTTTSSSTDTDNDGQSIMSPDISANNENNNQLNTDIKSVMTSNPPVEGAVMVEVSDTKQSVDDIGLKRMTILGANEFNDKARPQLLSSKSLHIGDNKRNSNSKYYICPSNTIVASNGDVYHVEPFQLPPPNEIAELFQELRKHRIRSDSSLSDGGSTGAGSTSKEKKSDTSHNISKGRRPRVDSDLAFGVHERPGSVRRKRFSLDFNNSESKVFPPMPHEWMMKEPTIIEQEDEDDNHSEQRPKSPMEIHIPKRDETSETASIASRSDRSTPRFVDHTLPVDISNFSLFGYLYSEIFGVGEPGHLEPDAVANINNFLDVPFKVEGLIQFGIFVCLDSFLFILTFLPLRVFFSTLALLSDCWMFCRSKVTGTTLFNSFHRTHAYDLMRGCLLLLGCFVLNMLNMSRVYHFIRGQTMIKLYVLTGMLEIFDKLLCTFGQDAFDSLYWQTCVQPDLVRIFSAYLVVCGYVLAHSCVYFVHVATLTVAFNSDDQALITVLILNNFSEIKGFVFKKFDKQQLFQLACSDITERFILVMFFSLVIIVAVAQAGDTWMKILPNGIYVVSLMVGGEAIADWIKHAFISKFNHINASVYQDYARILRKDVISASKNKNNLDHTYAISRRVGLSQIPLGCVLLRFLSLALSAPRPQAFLSKLSALQFSGLSLGVFTVLFCVKLALGLGLLMYSVFLHNSEEGSLEVAKKKLERNLWMDRLSNIERFTVWKGKIVG